MMNTLASTPGPVLAHDDPFVTTPSHKQPSKANGTFYDADSQHLNADNAALHAKHALETYIKDTDRRIQDASTLGTSLLQSRKRLVAQLNQVSKHRDSDEITPDLQAKLVELERDHSALSRDTARAVTHGPRFDPSEAADGPMSPAVYSASTRNSPSKVAAPSRRQRNQPSTRVHDIEFATEISTSLLAQVRQLQGVLAEKETALVNESSAKSQLEMDVAGMRQRIRSFEDNEQKYKDENWSLETQLQESLASIKDYTDKEQRANMAMRTAEHAKMTSQKDLADLKTAHNNLIETHDAAIRQHDAEAHKLGRLIANHGSDRQELDKNNAELQKNNDALTAQLNSLRSQMHRNESVEAAKANDNASDDDIDASRYSPPASPSKSARPGMLETETLKSSLQHAHRMIQTLKNNIHRERTDKNELKRLLQDARDDLENRRGDSSSTAATKKRRSDQETKPRRAVKAGDLGATRYSRQDIIMDDADWEDHAGTNPAAATKPLQTPFDESSDAFETANERDATETEAFQTSIEDMSDGGVTETETPIKHSVLARTRIMSSGKPGDRSSIQSTASISNDEDDQATPVLASQQHKYKLKLGQRGKRFDRHGKLFEQTVSDSFNSPAASHSSSTRSTPAAPKLSLGDELVGLSDDDETVNGTPSRASVRSTSSTPVRSSITKRASSATIPSASPRHATVLPRAVAMVDHSTMTEPWNPEQSVVTALAPTAAPTGPVPAPTTAPVSTTADTPADASAPTTAPAIATGLVASITGAIFGSSVQTSHEQAPSHQSIDTRETDIAVDKPMIAEFAPIMTQHIAPVAAPTLAESEAVPRSTPTTTNTNSDVYVSKNTVPAVALSDILSQSLSPSPESGFTPARDARKSTAALSMSGKEVVDDYDMDRKASLDNDKVSMHSTISNPRFTLIPHGGERDVPRRTRGDYTDTQDDVFGKSAPTAQPTLNNSTPFSRDTAFKFPGHARSASTPSVSAVMPLPATIEESRKAATDTPAFYVPAVTSPVTSPRRVLANTSSPRRSSDTSGHGNAAITTYRPNSAGTTRRVTDTAPPLPTDHNKRIAAAAQNTTSVPGSMGPPLMPASAYKANQVSNSTRSRTSSSHGQSRPGTNTSRSRVGASSNVIASPISRRSSVSSFASEVDQRLNPTNGVLYPADINPATDPRMIQAITQTMIGEYLWKYTRKAGRSEMSSSRHRRFFWIHPYTRTLYWSDRDPSTAGKHQLKAKSVAIESIRVDDDANSFPPGLYQKSLVIVTPGRDVVFTAPTAQRHETWVNALSYLLLRTAPEGEADDSGITDRDIAEFNPQQGSSQFRSNSRATGRSRISLGSHQSYATNRNASPVRHPLLDTPSLSQRPILVDAPGTPLRSPSKNEGSMSNRLSRVHDFFSGADGGSVSGRLRSLSPRKRDAARMSEGTSALRQSSDNGNAQDGHVHSHDGEGLENVRACCGGKSLESSPVNGY